MPVKKRDIRESAFDEVLSRSLQGRRNSKWLSGRARRPDVVKKVRTRLRLSLLLIGLSVAGGLWLTNGYLWRVSSPAGEASHRAAIIDELSLTDPGPSFVQNVTLSLKASGYLVDYFPPEQVTVDLLRSLPSKDYGLIIIRSHTAANAGIVTGEPYSQGKYVYEQLTDQLVEAVLGSGPGYFAIAPGFVGSEIKGVFPDSTILLMGCDGLQGIPQLAQALIDKGARFVIGWDSVVTVQGSDLASAFLVRRLAAGMSVDEAVRLTRDYPDPVYGGHLGYLSWNQVSGQRLNDIVYALASWSTMVMLLVLGPVIAILIPRTLGRR